MTRRNGMTVKQWREWGRQRKADAARLAKLYDNQSRRMAELMDEIDCPCNPSVMLKEGPDGPIMRNPVVNHALDCTYQ